MQRKNNWRTTISGRLHASASLHRVTDSEALDRHRMKPKALTTG
jgi:hypothetical protein